MSQVSALWDPVREAVSEHDVPVDQVSQAAGGMEIYGGPPGTLGGASLRWLGFESV